MYFKNLEDKLIFRTGITIPKLYSNAQYSLVVFSYSRNKDH